MTTNLPPFVGANDKVILFDGICKLCSAWSRFIIKHDSKHIFKLASVQSVEGQKILTFFSMPTDYYYTMLLLEGGKKFERSDAFLIIMGKLKFPWNLASVCWLIPKPVRDWLYDRIALNRYHLFGKHEQCLLPTADHKSRFISND